MDMKLIRKREKVINFNAIFEIFYKEGEL